MTDSEKIALIKAMIADFWECSNVSEDSVIALLNAVTVTIKFEVKE